MPETSHISSTESTKDIRIVGFNTDKTRRVDGSYTGYHVYLELSGTPPQAWREICGREWNDLNQSLGVEIDGRFLVIQCPLLEIPLHLPFLMKAVDATNEPYNRYVREQAMEEEHQGDVWKEERKAVEDIAETMRFD